MFAWIPKTVEIYSRKLFSHFIKVYLLWTSKTDLPIWLQAIDFMHISLPKSYNYFICIYYKLFKESSTFKPDNYNIIMSCNLMYPHKHCIPSEGFDTIQFSCYHYEVPIILWQPTSDPLNWALVNSVLFVFS